MFAETGTPKPDDIDLVLRDVLTIHGAELADADLIVASPPCQEYSYMAMPWGRAKQIGRALRGDDVFPDGFKGSRTLAELTALFNACFRIQREACQAAGLHVPMVVENVRGAQPWVGYAAWNFGSYYLWGDVPALMPITARAMKNGSGGSWFGINPDGTPGALNNARDGLKVPGFRFDGSGRSFQTASVNEGRKGGSGSWFNDYKTRADKPSALLSMTSSKSSARKAASAKIAKIPFALSSHIARVYRPTPTDPHPDGNMEEYFAHGEYWKLVSTRSIERNLFD